MEPEGSLPRLQQLATGPYLGPDESNQKLPPYFPMIQPNIFSSMPTSSKWSLSFRFSDQNSVFTSYLL